MTAGRGTLRQVATALLVAYALVLQALLGGLAYGTHAGSAVARDAFGQVLCVAADHGAPDEPGGHTPDCCKTACQLQLAGTVPPPTGAAFPAPLLVAGDVPLPAAGPDAGPSRPTGPNRARAPPAA